MSNPVTTQDIAARWRPLSLDEQTVASALLADAWEALLAQVPSMEARLADESLRVGLVRKVVTAMVLRVMRNPDGLRSETIDDYSRTRDEVLSAGLLRATDDELAELAAPNGLGDAFTINPFGMDHVAVVDRWL